MQVFTVVLKVTVNTVVTVTEDNVSDEMIDYLSDYDFGAVEVETVSEIP